MKITATVITFNEEHNIAAALESLAPRALPGEYEVRLAVGETTFAQRFTILPDPRLPVTLDDLRAQFELRRDIRDRLSDVPTPGRLGPPSWQRVAP